MALDVSLANTGWAVVEADGNFPEKLLAGDCIKTTPDPREKTKGADAIRRVAEIVRGLHLAIMHYRPVLLVAELPYGSKDASSAVAQGICYGVVGSVRQLLGIPLHETTPQAGKAAVAGKQNASTDAVQAAVLELWPEAGTWGGRRGNGWEHVADALAALVASRTSDLYRMAARSEKG